jgi:hypothetical protein
MAAVRRRHVALAATFATLVFASAGPAWAGDADQARTHFDAGKRARDEGDCLRAIGEFEKSLSVEKSIGAFYNLAYCHEQVGDRQEAYEAYRQAQLLASAKKDDRLREISGALASLLETPHVRLIFSDIPPGTQVKVDDQAIPNALLQREMVLFTRPLKKHAVVVSAPGFDEWRASMDTKQFRTVDLRPTGPAHDAVAPPPTTKSEWGWGQWTGIGVGVVGLGLLVYGGINGLDYESKESDYLDQVHKACPKFPNCSTQEAANEQTGPGGTQGPLGLYNDNQGRLAGIDATLVTGGVLLAGGILLFFLVPKNEVGATPSTVGSVRFAPFFTGTTRGLGASGKF